MRQLFVLLALFCTALLPAQTFPVQLTVAAPNASVYPLDMAAPGALVVSMTLIDRTRLEPLPVLLDLTITDQRGTVLRVGERARMPQFLLRPNVPTLVQGAALEGLLSAMVDVQYSRRGLGEAAGARLFGNAGPVLAEGPLEICAKVFVAARPDVPAVSNPACAYGFADLQPPPSFLQPTPEALANEADLVNFSWQPNHIGGPVDYELTVWPTPRFGRWTPDMVTRFEAPINTVLIRGGATIYGGAGFVGRLTPGEEYVYQVRAVDPLNRIRFENGGYSRPETFLYRAPDNPLDNLCYSPADLTFERVTGGLYRAEWTGLPLVAANHTLTISRPGGSFVYQTMPNNDPANLPRTDVGDGEVRYGFDLAEDWSLGTQGLVARLCVTCPATGATNCAEVILPGSGGPGPADDQVDEVVDDITSDDEDPQPCLIDDRALNVTAATIEAQSVELNWTYTQELPSTASGVLVTYGPAFDRPGPPDSLQLGIGASSFRLTDLTPSTDYEVTVCLRCSDGGSGCTTTTVRTAPWDCPTEARLLAGVTVTGIAPDGISVDWRPASLNADPMAWTVELDRSGDPRLLDAVPGPFLFDGLEAGSEHSVTVCHRCAETGVPTCVDFPVTVPACAEFDLALTATEVTFGEATLSWAPNTTGTYLISEREADGGGIHHLTEVNDNVHTLSGLQPLTSYEVVVCSPCGSDQLCDTTVVTTTNVSCELAGLFEYAYECGTDGPVDPFENEEAIDFLSPGDSVWAGDFLIEVSSVTGSGPQFDGHGYAQVPYLNGARVKVEFQQIEVNDNCRMVRGHMTLVSPITEALLAIQSALADILDVLGDVSTVLGNISHVLGEVTGILNDVATSADVTDEALAMIEQTAITLSNVPYMPDSLIQAIQDGADCMRDAARPAPGDDAEVRRCRDQTIAAIAAAQAWVDQLFNAPYAVDFRPTGEASRIYGFDQQPHPLVTEDYPQRTVAGEPYRTPWVSTSTTDAQGTAIVARRADGQPLPSDVRFIETADVDLTDDWTLASGAATHPGLRAAGDQQSRVIFAALPNPDAGDTLPPVTMAGQLNLITYTPVVRTVHVVPVNGATVPLSAAALQDSLNAYYRPAVASWTVVVQPNLEVLDFGGELSDIPNNLLSNYTPEMALLRRAVRQQSYHDADALYLIVVPRMAEDDRLGFMPRKRRFGFLTAEDRPAAAVNPADPAVFARTAAHELAHGAFHLEHIYDRFAGLQPGATDNLMDRGLGTALYKYQWDNVHDPESNFTLLDEEGEGESVNLCPDYTMQIIDDIDYFTPQDENFLYPFLHRMRDRFGIEVVVNTYDAETVYPISSVLSGCSIEENTYNTLIINVPNCNGETNITVYRSNDVENHIPDDTLTVAVDQYNTEESTCSDVVSNLASLIIRLINSKRIICSRCQSDITVTAQLLEDVFENSTHIFTSSEVDCFNRIFEVNGYNTCRSHAHVFSQVRTETNNYTAFVEVSNYRMENWFVVFDGRTRKPYLDTFFQQRFYDSLDYQNFFHHRVYLDTASSSATGTHASTGNTTFRGAGRTNATLKSVNIPSGYVTSSTGTFTRYRPNAAQIELCNQNMWSYTYGGFLGNLAPSTLDGYNFRGRGAIQITGRDRFTLASTTIRRLFNLTVDLARDYDLVSSDSKIRIFSAGAFFYTQFGSANRKNTIRTTDNVVSVSHWVNGTNPANGLAHRTEYYNHNMSHVYSCP